MPELGVVELSSGEGVSVPLVCAEECPSLRELMDLERQAQEGTMQKEFYQAQIRGIGQVATELECSGPFEARSHKPLSLRTHKTGPMLCNVTTP